MERGQRLRGERTQREERRGRSDEKRGKEKEKERERETAKERDKKKSVEMVRGERNTPGTPNHGIVEPLGPGPCLTRVS